jgi:hypothetical protein
LESFVCLGVLRHSRISIASAAVLACLACSSDDGARETFGTSNTSITTTLTTGDDDQTSGPGDGDGDNGDGDGDATTTGPLLDVAPGDGDGDGDPNECAAVSETAQNELLPVDIIFAVDTSGSMDMEKAFVQQNMNIFSQQIFLANIDHHVVVIADNSLCINVPLGSGNCPDDTSLPEYLHLNQTVNSNDALQVILSTQPQWAASIRPGSIKHVVVVSDDNSEPMTSGQFHVMFEGISPDYEGYFFHAIVAYSEPNPFECFGGMGTCCEGFIPLSAAKGQVYLELVALTGGVSGDLCDQQFGPVFDQIAQSVLGTTPLACEWDIPEPPLGQTFDPMKVNVELTLDGMQTDVYYVENEAACGGGDGWYYYPDNVNPETIRICPATCAEVQGAEQASVDILFGCETIPVG